MKDNQRKAMFTKFKVGDRVITEITDRKATILSVEPTKHQFDFITVKFDPTRFKNGKPEKESFEVTTGRSDDFRRIKN